MNEGWGDLEEIEPMVYTCGYCGKEISSNLGYEKYFYNGVNESIYICHNCGSPTYFDRYGKQTPGNSFGSVVQHLPEEIGIIYSEARECFSVDAFTSSVLCCRKLLMNISCEKGAKAGESFESYVNYLNDNGYIPPDGKQWVDKIRKLGNKATHKLEIRSKEDAELAIKFTSMLLKFVYEFPKLLEL